MFLFLGPFLLVVVLRPVVAAGDPGGSKELIFELFVSGRYGQFAVDRGSRAPWYRSDAGVGGEVSGGSEGAGAADGQEYRRGVLDADSRHGHRDRGKTEGVQEFFDFFGHDGALVFELLDLRGDTGDAEFEGFGTDHGHGLPAQGRRPPL